MRFQERFTDRGFKAASWTLENKNGNVHISSKLNSAFSTIGKATTDKITAKLVGKFPKIAEDFRVRPEDILMIHQRI